MEEIIVILNHYKRPEYLCEQIEAILNQTIKPKEIWLWDNNPNLLDEFISSQNSNSGKLSYHLENDIDVRIESSRNFKYHGRFSLGLLTKSKYLAYFDDDTIPGFKWFENCLNTLKNNPRSILGGAGCILNSTAYVYHTRAGWPTPSEKAVEVDLVGHAWFMERDLLNHLWSNTPPTFENGEDMQLSMQAYINCGIKSICPPHPQNDPQLWSSLKPWEYGNDSKASSNGSLKSVPQFYKERDELIEHYIRNGYEPVVRRAK